MLKKKLSKFDTKVQQLKHAVLQEVARRAFDDTLLDSILDIPKIVVSGPEPSMRCCIYKERAIVAERVKMAMGGHKDNPSVIEVVDIACDECPASGYEIIDSCRGCIAHRCEEVCPREAITFDLHQKAHIDKKKCVNCGLCAKVCPYGAIINKRRPCERACKIHAISPLEGGHAAHIDPEICVCCGACVYQCPFGAIIDKSYILDAIKFLKNADNSPNSEDRHHVYAVIAPSISSQFIYAKMGRVISGLRELGFYKVVEAALGADLVADEESRELVEQKFLSSSCCPAFVSLVKKQFPTLTPHISSSLSPMAAIGKLIKTRHPESKVVFIGPCTAKKHEIQLDTVKDYIDCVITFEELLALFDSRDINIVKLPESEIDHASYFGRRFARCGGLAEAVAQGLKEHGNLDFVYQPVSCDGLEECVKTMKLAEKSLPVGNFIEGMACSGGCIGGAGCLTHADRSRIAIEKYGEAAKSHEITKSIETSKFE